ncbi:MAG: hypothetical protein ACREN5_07435, partial [Gemmatimonadales bacterium]
DRRSTFDRMPFAAPLGFQVPLGGLESFRRLNGVLATSASTTTTWNATTGLGLLAGLRATGSFLETFNTSWLLRGSQQARLTQYTRDWPSGTVSWTMNPPAPVGRVLVNLTTQAVIRRRIARTLQAAVAGAGGPVVPGSKTSVTTTTLSPSVILTWARGILTSVDLTRDRTENVTTGSRFLIDSRSRAGNVNFAFRPPASVVRLPGDIRVQGRLSDTKAVSCIQQAGTANCVTFADTRRTQTQMTVETSFPPNFTAGLQYSQLHSEERQLSRSFTQTVFTGYVTISLSVGQLP